jgi:Type II secretion system (T2SS), protein E, N-terminal domain
MKLGTLLLRNAALSLSQLESGLRTQVLYGGRLGTNLVELGFLDIDVLGDQLGELYQIPVATKALLDGARRDVLQRVTAQTAASLGAIPLGHLPPFVDSLAVAMIDPRDDHAVDQLTDQTGMTITPYIVSELRALYYLERHYGLPRQARFVRPGTRRGGLPVDRRRAQPIGGIVAPPSVRLEPRRKTVSEIVVAPPPPPPPLAFADAVDRIDSAAHRDDIAATLLEFAAGRFPALVLFLVRDGNALGWRAWTEKPLPHPISELSLPIGGTSALQCANDDLRPFRGRPPAAAQPTEKALWSFLGLGAVAEVAVAPVMVRQRAVNLIYAHPRGDRFDGAIVDELNQLSVRASESYVRLIRQAKH